MWLQLTLKCNGQEEEIPESLQGIFDNETEWRPCMVNTKTIAYVFPSSSGFTLIKFLGDEGETCFKESVDEILKRIGE